MHTISGMVPYVVARTSGLDLEVILRGTGLDPATPPPAEDHVDVARYYDVWRRVMAQMEPAFPLRVATAFQLEDHEVFGFLAMSCETLGHAYARTAAYRALYATGARWELELDGEASRLLWYPWPGDLADPGYRAAMEFAVADMADAIRRLGREAPQPRAVRLVHPEGPYRELYGAPVTYGAPLYELVYAPGLPDQPIHTFNSRLRDYFDDACKQLVAKHPSAGLVPELRKHLIGAMDGGDPGIEAIAKRMAMSSRSLQRKLGEEGTRYADVLADVRAEFAKRYLARGTISASEVAYLIGFTEPPAFFKAFKRWTGMTPREFQLRATG